MKTLPPLVLPLTLLGCVLLSCFKENAHVASAFASSVDPKSLVCQDIIPSDKIGGFDAYRWPNGRKLKVAFIDDKTSVLLRERVLKYASQWSEHANITFHEVTPHDAPDIRVTFKGNGHWSRIGIDSLSEPGSPSMSLLITDASSDEDVRRVSLHEFGHAIGLAHEHQLPSSAAIGWVDSEVEKYYGGPPNCWTHKQIEDNVLKHYNPEYFKLQYTKFDAASIMCYPIPKGLARNVVVGWNTTLSQTDIDFITKWYPKKV